MLITEKIRCIGKDGRVRYFVPMIADNAALLKSMGFVRDEISVPTIPNSEKKTVTVTEKNETWLPRELLGSNSQIPTENYQTGIVDLPQELIMINDATEEGVKKKRKYSKRK